MSKTPIADSMSDKPEIKFSSAQNPRSWDINAAFDAGVITCLTDGDAKKAESIFNQLQRDLNAANAKLEQLKSKPCPYVTSSDEGTNYCTLPCFGDALAERYRAALVKIKAYNESILWGQINYRPEDHIKVVVVEVRCLLSEALNDK